MMKNLKTILEELSSTSTAYGIPTLARSKRLYQKILWIFFILGGIVGSCFLVYDAIKTYLDHEVVTVIQTIYEQPTEFPTITICGFNMNFDGKKPSDIFKVCYFGYDNSCTYDQNNYFEPHYSNEYGLCFRFNSGKNFTNNSIPLVRAFVGGVDDAFNIKVDRYQDLALWIHNRSTPPVLDYKNSHYNNRIFAPSDTYTDIAIEKTFEVKLGEPFNKCLKDVSKFKKNKTIINFVFKMNQTYTQERCLELCFDLDYIEVNPCNCTNVNLGDVWNICWNFRENKTKDKCTWKYKEEFYSGHIAEKCSKYCPLECMSIYYNIRPNTLPKYNDTRLKIYYSSLKYTSIREEPKMQLIDIISNVGGTLGLLIGFSFVTFFELFEFLIELILYGLSYRINSETNSVSM